ncbi:MAG: dienelactone hydrolase family protein [Planctomycetota bacterium]
MNTLRILPVVFLLPFVSACGTSSAEPESVENVTIVHEIQTEEVRYEGGGAELNGYLAYPLGASAEDKLPGVIVVHEWWGHNDYARRRADQLASLGYVAFALDMFGDGKLAEHPDDAGAFAKEATSNPERMSARFGAALSQLQSRDFVDTSKTAAIGYCMGGGVVLNMTRLGADLDLVASFHGSLPTEGDFGATERERAEVLVFTGAADPFVPAEKVEAFEDFFASAPGMSSLEVVSYPGVVHSFSNPDATATGEKFELPLRYDAAADQDSWQRFLSSLRNLRDSE